MRITPLAPLLALLAALPAPARAQSQTGTELRGEFAQLREAAALESRGDVSGAEQRVRAVLAVNPGSLTALIALDRLLTLQGRPEEVLPAVERALERDRAATVAHQVRLRTLSRLDRVPELERAAAEWLAAVPQLETPYREIARTWLERHEHGRALRVLEQGRERVGNPAALALELGDVHAAAGDYPRAAAEWSRAVGASGQGLAAVQRRLAELPDAGSAVIPELVRTLGEPGAPLARRRAAIQLALGAGLAGEVERLLGRVLAELPARQRTGYLAEVARRADGAGLRPLALWAYEQLTRTAEGDTTRLLALRTRVAQLALETGDTVRAARTFATLESAAAAGSPERRQAVATRLMLRAEQLATPALGAALDSFRTEFPDAPERTDVAAAVGTVLVERGELDAAERALAGVSGARASLARGRLFLRRGELPRARNELLLAAPALRGAEATATLALASALARMGAPAGELLARALGEEDPAATVDTLLAGAAAHPARERAAILDFAAHLADAAALADAAERARRTLLELEPASDAAPAALLWLARRAAARPEGRDEARVLLERLIIEHPRSALVPQARRALERLPGRAPEGA